MDRGRTARRWEIGVLLMPFAVVVLMGAAVLRVGGWIGAVVVLTGALLLVTGIALVAGPAHTEHVASRRGRPSRPRHR